MKSREEAKGEFTFHVTDEQLYESVLCLPGSKSNGLILAMLKLLDEEKANGESDGEHPNHP